jgi:hypothetical protein
MEGVLTLSMKRLIEHPAWSFYGILLALISLAFTIYQIFYVFNYPSIKVNYIGEIDILNIDKHSQILVDKLEFLYKGVNIREKNQNLKLFLLSVLNDGYVDILKNFFDDHDPLGFQISSGKILYHSIVGASSRYLEDNITMTLHSPQKVILSPIIIDKKSRFVIQLLVLHEKDTNPIVKATGKIAGIKEIEAVPLVESPKSSNLSIAFGGSADIQMLRVYVYFFIGIIVIISFVIVLINIRKILYKYRFRDVGESIGGNIDKTKNMILENYSRTGKMYIKQMLYHIGSDENIKDIYIIDPFNGGVYVRPSILMSPNVKEMLDKLVTFGIVRKQVNEIDIDYNEIKSIRDICRRLL